jgi:hypothetical protein
MYGYYATVTVKGLTPRSAFDQVPVLLNQRMKTHKIMKTLEGASRTQCRADDFWELTEDISSDAEEAGFSFFKIGFFSAPRMLLEFWWFKLFRAHMLIDLTTTSAA